VVVRSTEKCCSGAYVTLKHCGIVYVLERVKICHNLWLLIEMMVRGGIDVTRQAVV